jgi:hypothetical protein
VTLRWLAPASNGGAAITDYLVQRSPNGSTGWTTINDGVSTATSRVVSGLTNGSRYYFRVFAKNAVGMSPASSVVTAVPTMRPSAPTNFRVTSSYDGHLLSWGLPASNGGLAITDYVIQYRSDGTWLTYFDGVSTSRSLWIAASGYGCNDFRVAATNAVGAGAYAYFYDACFFSVPSEPFSFDGYVDYEFWEYWLSWTGPIEGGGLPIDGYTLQYWSGAGWSTIWTGDESYTWEIVGPYIGCVDFRVAAFNAWGTGPYNYLTLC